MRLTLHATETGKTGHEYMRRSGRLRRPGRGLDLDIKTNPKNSPITGSTDAGFRLIVDD